jgi:hypothetical protein
MKVTLLKFTKQERLNLGLLTKKNAPKIGALLITRLVVGEVVVLEGSIP